MNSTRYDRQILMRAAAMAVVFAAGAAEVQADEATKEQVVEFQIEATSLDAALQQFSAQSGAPLLFSKARVSGHGTKGVSGRFDPGTALDQLLKGTGFKAVRGEGQAFLIREEATQAEAPSPPAPEPERIEKAPVTPEPDPADAYSDTLRAEKITVTGTSLRGITPESSPLFIYGREDILNSGASTTEQFIRSLPQNFGGGSTEFAPGGLPEDFSSAKNNTLGTGGNLRGLGSGGTLVLLNGNRVAPTSTVGDFVDLSMIPVSALERVDVLTDGASAIYGGDAVAGVINFVLREDFDGAETMLHYGRVTDGGLAETRASQTLGTAWDSGSILATYEYFDRGNLTLADRPDIAAPTLNSGVAISDRDRFDLLPGQRRDSALLAFSQDLAPGLKLSGSGLYSSRKAESTAILAGATSLLQTSGSKSDTLSLAGDLAYDLSTNWSVRLKGAYSEIRNDQDFLQAPLTGASGTSYEVRTNSDVWSLDLLTNGTLARLPGGELSVAFGAHYREEGLESRVAGSAPTRDGNRRVASAYAELLVPVVGAGNAVPGIERFELSLSGRLDDYSDFGTSSNPKVGLLWSPVSDLNLRSSYSTSFAPPALGYVGALDRGAIVVPYAYMAAAYGVALPDPSLDVDMMFVSGTGENLQPEESRTFTAGLDYSLSRGSHDWAVHSTFYDISFDGRLGQSPVPGGTSWYVAPNIAWADSSAFPDGTIVFFPDADEVAETAASLSQAPILYLGGSLENVGIINKVNLVRNLASTKTRGIDFQLDYSVETDAGRWTAGVNANKILDFTRQASSTTPEVSVLDTFLNPASLKLRASAGFARGGFTGNLFVNHTGSYRTDTTAASEPISSWTTADATFSYAFDPSGHSWLKGVQTTLSVTNLFDKAPPATPTLGANLVSGYDPANASPVGRFVAVELRKAF